MQSGQDYDALAGRCKMGDVKAMLELAYLFYDKCTEEQKQLLSQYERDPEGDSRGALWEYMSMPRNRYENMETYMMWIVRAAIYGNKTAEDLLEKCRIYKEKATLPYNFYSGNKDQILIWSSNSFRATGFPDIIPNHESCGLICHQDVGIMEFYYVSFYDPPDEDGFGMETEYEYILLDEFFKILPVAVNTRGPVILTALKKNEEERENYWKNQPDQSGKYTKTPFKRP